MFTRLLTRLSQFFRGLVPRPPTPSRRHVPYSATIRGKSFSWSASRGRLFESCKRKYFFVYYGTRRYPQLERLSKLTTIPFFIGGATHTRIERYLKSDDPRPSRGSLRSCVDLACERAWKMSSQNWATPNNTPYVRFVEDEYALPEAARDAWDIRDPILKCLDNFFDSDVAKELASADRDRLSIEVLDSFDVGGTPVQVKMDAAYRRPDGSVRIVDWKTGWVNDHDAEQIGVYALYAVRKGWAPPERITATLAYLTSGETRDVPVTPEFLARAEARIQKSISDIRARLKDPARNIAQIRRFPQTPDRNECHLCAYQGACFPERRPARKAAA